MRFTAALVPTVKEAPADAACASQRLLVRAGYVRRVSSGGLALLPLGVRVLHKIERIVREEIAEVSAQEIRLLSHPPLVDPDATVIDLARREVRSFRDMPALLFQIALVSREVEGKQLGLLRSREDFSLRVWSLDVDEVAAKTSAAALQGLGERVLERVGLRWRRAEADAGLSGEAVALALPVSPDAADGVTLTCASCAHAVTEVIATARAGEVEVARERRTEVHTPDARTIEQVSAFLDRPATKFLKSLVYATTPLPLPPPDEDEDEPPPSAFERELVLAIVRGDHEVNEVLLARAIGVVRSRLSLATEVEVERATGATLGFAGPVGFRGRILVDRAAASVADAVVGANRTDHHFAGVNRGRDWEGEVVDLRRVVAGDPCPACAQGILVGVTSIEGGRITVGNTRQSALDSILYTSDRQEKLPIAIGTSVIGFGRLLAGIVEQHHDDDGIQWPVSVAPFGVHLVTIGQEAIVLSTAATIYDTLVARGIEVLWDDRDERPGVKFKDADLLGIPFRVTLGAKGLAGGNVELKARRAVPAGADPKKDPEIVRVEDIVRELEARLRGGSR